VSFQAVADNLRESFRVIAASREPGEIREMRGVSIASAGVAFQMFNAAFLSAPVATENDLSQRVLLAATHFQQRGLDWAYWICDDWIDGHPRRRMRQILERNGLRHSVDLPGMFAEGLRPPVRPAPVLEVRRVENAPTREAFCSIGSVCFHVPIHWFMEVFSGDVVWREFHSYVGYLRGEPVSTAAVVTGGGVLGVYNVATLPGHQRRGYGEHVMRCAIEDVGRRNGKQAVVLQSTPAGLRLYERMGFRTITRVAVYAT